MQIPGRLANPCCCDGGLSGSADGMGLCVTYLVARQGEVRDGHGDGGTGQASPCSHPSLAEQWVWGSSCRLGDLAGGSAEGPDASSRRVASTVPTSFSLPLYVYTYLMSLATANLGWSRNSTLATGSITVVMLGKRCNPGAHGQCRRIGVAIGAQGSKLPSKIPSQHFRILVSQDDERWCGTWGCTVAAVVKHEAHLVLLLEPIVHPFQAPLAPLKGRQAADGALMVRGFCCGIQVPTGDAGREPAEP
jgi:hypothetical protein